MSLILSLTLLGICVINVTSYFKEKEELKELTKEHLRLEIELKKLQLRDTL